MSLSHGLKSASCLILARSIQMPVISALFKQLTGDDLTLRNAVSIILAIPMTIVCKLITGAAPPKLGPIDPA